MNNFKLITLEDIKDQEKKEKKDIILFLKDLIKEVKNNSNSEREVYIHKTSTLYITAEIKKHNEF